MQKSNFDFLRQLIKNGMPAEKHREEAEEFLDAVKKEMDGLRDRIESLKEEYQCDEDAILFRHTEEPRWIEAGVGYIEWDSNNFKLIQIMETLEDKLNTETPDDILYRPTTDIE